MNTKFLLLLISLSINGLVFSQNNKIIEISSDACECISVIDSSLNQKVKSEKITECIKTANTTYQLQNSLEKLLDSAKDSLKNSNEIDTLSIGKEDINIVLNEDANYEEIEQYLYDNCESLKEIYFSNDVVSKNSLSDKKKAIKFYNKGQNAFRENDLKKAIKLFKKAVKKDENFAFAWDNLGYAYRKLNDFESAIECYKKSLKIDPKGKMPLMNIAVAYELNNQIEEAKKSYREYRNIYKEDPESYYGLGRLQYLGKEYKPALENMIQAYYLYNKINSPYNIDAQKHISFIYAKLKELDKLDIFNEVTKRFGLEVNFKE